MDDWNGLIIENLVRVYSDLGQQQKAWDMQEKLIKADARRAEAMQAKYRFPSIRPVTQDPPMQFNVAAASTPKPVIQPVASRVCGDGAHLICSAIQAESTTSTTIKDAQSAVVASPDNVDNWIALGIAYRENSQLDEGERALLEAVRRSPNSARAITELGRIEKAKGNTAKLAELHGNLTKIDSSAAEAYFRELILP
jgi:tetratricopeptide (TPR) repeat protein